MRFLHALLAALLLGLAAGAAAQAPLQLREVDFLRESAPGALPAIDAPWQTYALPLRWNGAAGGRHGGWLRLRFELPAAPVQPLAVLLPQLPSGGLLYANDRLVAEIPTGAGATHVQWRRPHLIDLPPDALRAGANTLLVRLDYGAGPHGLSAVLVGSKADLQARSGREFFVAHTLAWTALLMTTLVAAAFAALWLRRRAEGLFGLLALAAGFWALRLLDSTLEVVPADGHTWLRMAFYAGTGGFTAVAALAMLRRGGMRRRALEIGIGLAAALGPVLYLLGGEGFDLTFGPAWQAAMLALLALGLGVLARRTLTAPGLLARIVTLALLLMLAAMVHDYLVTTGVLPFGSLPMLNIATPLLLVVLAGALVDRFVRSLAEVEHNNSELESRISERESLLKRNYDRLRETERAKAGAQERQRIMQDMHDGLGSQLLSSLMLVERGALSNEQVAQILRESIDDMRLAIDALGNEDLDLLAALGNLRFRMEPRLKAAAIQLQWDARNLPDQIGVASEAVLPILRVVQEAITNAVKHSGGNAVRVTLGVDQDGDAQWLSIRITDNGRGLVAGPTGGRGLNNMRTRAGRIGALLRIESVPGAGTMVLLRYRLERVIGPNTRAQQLSLNTEAVIEQVKAM